MPWAAEPFRLDSTQMKRSATVRALSVKQIDRSVSFNAEIESIAYGHRVRLRPLELDPDATAH